MVEYVSQPSLIGKTRTRLIATALSVSNVEHVNTYSMMFLFFDERCSAVLTMLLFAC
jgi:hypothetical protein